jgi:nucleotide-binding universal stress UspA family protein
MKRFKSILVVASDEDVTRRLLVSAAELAERNGASLTLFDVIGSVPDRRRFVHTGQRDLDLQVMMADSRLEQLREMAAEVGSPQISLGVANGTPFIEIIKRVEAFGHDLVIVAPDAPRRTSGLAGAATAMHLLRKCPVPVWVEVGESGAPPAVAVAVGPFDEWDRSGSLNITLVELASSLAALRGGSLHVVHAWRLEGESLLRSRRLAIPAEEVDLLVAAARHEAATNLEAVLEAAPAFDAPVEVHLAKGDPGVEIPSFVEDYRPGVVVMGMIARTGLKGAIISNTAERVLGLVDASILAVKPEGFVSPLAG